MTNIPVSERSKWIGASESAALFGVSPNITKFELWHQKAGNIPPPDLSLDERVNAGQFMEPSIAAWAQHKWHWPILKVDDYRPSPHVNRMGASFDFMTVDGAEPVEIKNIDYSVFMRDYDAEGDVIVDAPADKLIQVQHQLACPRPGAKIPDRGWLVACVGGNRLYRMEILRHDALIVKLETEVTAFWGSIEKNEPPIPDFQADTTALALLYGGTGEEFLDLRGNERALYLAAEYLKAHEIVKAGDTRKKAALNELKYMLGQARGALIDGGYSIKASHIDEATIHRNAFWRFNIRRKESK